MSEPSLSAARRRLAARQDALVRALVAAEETAEPFDPVALDRARRVIADKRAWTAARRAQRAPASRSLGRWIAEAWRWLRSRSA